MPTYRTRPEAVTRSAPGWRRRRQKSRQRSSTPMPPPQPRKTKKKPWELESSEEEEEPYEHIVDPQIQEAVKNSAAVWVKELVTTLAVPTPENPNSGEEIALQARQSVQARAAGGLAELLVPGVRVKALASGGSLPRTGEDVAWNRTVLIEAGAVAPLARLLAAPARGTAAGTSAARDAQFAAAAAISALSHDEEGRRQIVAAGAVGNLVRLLEVDSHDAQLSALSALRTLGCNREQRQAIRQEGGIPHFVRLLADPNPLTQEAACAALWQLAFDSLGDQNRLAMEAAGCVPRVLRLTLSADEGVRSAAETLVELLGLDKRSALAQIAAAEEAERAIIQSDYEKLEAEQRRKEQHREKERWLLEKEQKKKAEALQKEVDKLEATRRMHAAHAAREQEIKAQKAREYEEWLDKMKAKREEEEAAIIAAGGTVKERPRNRMKAAGRTALLGVAMAHSASAASIAKAARPESAEERAARLQAERSTTPIEEWSKEACKQWVGEVVGLPELAEKLMASTKPELDGRLIKRLTHSSYREAFLVWSAIERF